MFLATCQEDTNGTTTKATSTYAGIFDIVWKSETSAPSNIGKYELVGLFGRLVLFRIHCINHAMILIKRLKVNDLLYVEPI